MHGAIGFRIGNWNTCLCVVIQAVGQQPPITKSCCVLSYSVHLKIIFLSFQFLNHLLFKGCVFNIVEGKNINDTLYAHNFFYFQLFSSNYPPIFNIAQFIIPNGHPAM